MPDLVPRDTHDDLFSNTLFGIRMLQTFADLRLWEWVLSNHPVRSVIELGTGNGAFSLYLAMQCAMREAHLLTVDLYANHHFSRAPLPVQQVVGDMWGPAVQGDVRRWLADANHHPALLFCDGGNKPRELQTFASWLAPGDLAAVHDYGTEFNPADADPVRDLLAELLADAAYGPDNFTRFYRRLP